MKFKYTGVNVEQNDKHEIFINQDDFAKNIEPVSVPDKADNNTNLNEQQLTKYRGALGKLSWLAETTRPDIAYDCLEASTHNKDAKIRDLKNLNKAIDKVKKIKGVVKYGKVGDFKELKILAISDGSYLKLDENNRSVRG